MEQQQQTPENPSADRRRARMLRELEGYGMNLGLLVEVFKYGAAMVAGATLTIWLITNSCMAFSSPVEQLVNGYRTVRGAEQRANIPATAAPNEAASKQPDTPQRDVHDDSAFPVRP